MKVLVVNNYFYLRGGCERVMFNDMDGLTRRGVEVVPFSAADPANVESEYAASFVPGADIRATSARARVEAAIDAVHCRRTTEAFGSAIDRERPDVIHCHNIYGRLSTSILKAARKRQVPVVLTVHDYKVVCPSYLMLKDGKPCTACLDGGYYRCAVNRCHKGQLAASIVYSIESYYSRLTGNYDAVSAFLCPSRFVAGLLRRSGIGEERVVYHPNCVEPSEYRPSYGGDYVLSVGRLSHEKGLPTLVRCLLDSGIPLRVAGTGPMEQALRESVRAAGGAVRFEGHCEGERLRELYRGAAFTVVPSEWYENAPMSVLESFAYGKPVVGTRIGGIPELLADGECGYLVEPSAPEQLRAAIEKLWHDREAQIAMGRRARRLIETRFAAEARIDSLLAIYAKLSPAAQRFAGAAAAVAASA